MGEHSEIVGGSGANRYINCPGSVPLRKKAPPREAGEAAETGTMLHFITESILNAEPGTDDADPLSWVGDKIAMDEVDPETGERLDFEVTEEHITQKIMPALEWFDKELAPEAFWCEQKVEFDGALEGAFGTADVLYHGGKPPEGYETNKAGGVDWKFGDNVTVTDDTQGRFYTAAAIKKAWFGKDFDEFHFYIVQIRNGVAEVTHFLFTREELQMFEQRLLAAHMKVQAGSDELTIGAWCKFCPAETICPAWRNRGEDALANVPRETLKPPTAKQKKDPEFQHISYDHAALRQSHLIAVLLSSWCDAVKKLVKKEFDEGRPVEGLKKVVYQNGKQWVDVKKAQGWVRRNGLKAADYNEPAEFKSVAKITALLKAEDVKLDSKLWGEVPSGHQYVATDDPRPSVGDGGDPAATSSTLAAALQKAQS